MISENTKIKVLKKLDVTDLGGEKVMIDFETGKYFLLKGTANDIWDLLDKNVTIGDIKQRLLQRYDVDDSTCYQAVIRFLEQIEQYHFIQLIG